MRELIDIDWNDVCEATPAALTALIMPFTYLHRQRHRLRLHQLRGAQDRHRQGPRRASGHLAGRAAVRDPLRLFPSEGRAVRHGRLRPEPAASAHALAASFGHGLRQSRRLAKAINPQADRLLPAGLEFVDTLPKYPSIWSPPCTLNATPLAPAPVPQQARSASPVRPRRRLEDRPMSALARIPFSILDLAPSSRAATRPTPSATPSRSRSRPNDWLQPLLAGGTPQHQRRGQQRHGGADRPRGRAQRRCAWARAA